MIRRARASVGLVLVMTVVVAAQAPRAPRFRYERSIELTQAGSQRLDVDVSLLSGASPSRVTTSGERRLAVGGLRDLRLFNSDNVEVPYLLIAPRPAEPVWLDGRVLDVASTEKTSGFELDLGAVEPVGTLRLTGMRAPFLKRFRLEGSGDRERWTVLVADGTAFDLPAEGLHHTDISFDPGLYRYLRITWDDTNSGRVGPPPMAAARRVAEPIPGPILRTPLIVERRPSEPRTSRFRLRLPAARLPIVALELTLGEGYLLRQASVFEARLTGSSAVAQRIGAATLRRVVRDGLTADALVMEIEQPAEAQLELVVDDGDNPPLDLRGVSAVFAELPWIYFESPAGVITARYGDSELDAPRYDLEAARADAPAREVARAMWGEAQSLPAEMESAGLPMPDTGTVIETTAFRYARRIPDGASGLVAVPLDGAVLAHSGGVNAGFSDVRVIDAQGRQVPYLLERRDEPLTMNVRIERRDLGPLAAPQQTAYVVHLPYELLPAATIALETRARVFTRGVTLAILVPPDERRREPWLERLTTSLWTHAAEAQAAPALIVAVPERRRGEMVLIVDEGDNQPLPIERATLLQPSYAVRLFHPPDRPLRLLYGRPGMDAPRYDLALLAPRVLGAVAAEVHAGPEEPPAATATVLSIVPPPVFWGVLSVAVLVLLGLIGRLMRRTDSVDGAQA